MVLFLDMNSYFASVEQQQRPELRGSPVGVIPNDCDTTCCIAASYEAKAHGVTTGTGVLEARARCPSIALVLSRPDVYIRTHARIIEAVDTVHPVHEVHSIDEMSFKLRGPDRDPLTYRRLAMAMKAAIRDTAGEWLRCSIGIAPNAMLAKAAGEMVKPDGLVVIEPRELPHRLYTMKVTDLPGISTGIERRLRTHGIYTMPQLCTASKRRLREAWGSIVGETWWEWLNGNDPFIRPFVRKNIGHQHVLPPERRSREAARAVIIRLLMKAATRMRAEGYWCRKLTIFAEPMGLDENKSGLPKWRVYRNLEPCQCTIRLLRHADELWSGMGHAFVFAVGVTLGELVKDANVEEPLFEADRKQTKLAHTMDSINTRWGHATIYPGSMHDARQAAPLRIPFGSVPDLRLPDTV